MRKIRLLSSKRPVNNPAVLRHYCCIRYAHATARPPASSWSTRLMSGQWRSSFRKSRKEKQRPATPLTASHSYPMHPPIMPSRMAKTTTAQNIVVKVFRWSPGDKPNQYHAKDIDTKCHQHRCANSHLKSPKNYYRQCRNLPLYLPPERGNRVYVLPGRPYPAGSAGYSQSI